FFLYKDREAARAEAGVASAKAQEALDKLASASSAKGELEQRLDKLESEKADLTALKNELSKDVQAKSDELQKLKGTYDRLQDKMKNEIAKGDIKLSQAGGKLRVDLIDKVVFDSGDTMLSKRGEE